MYRFTFRKISGSLSLRSGRSLTPHVRDRRHRLRKHCGKSSLIIGIVLLPKTSWRLSVREPRPGRENQFNESPPKVRAWVVLIFEQIDCGRRTRNRQEGNRATVQWGIRNKLRTRDVRLQEVRRTPLQIGGQIRRPLWLAQL